MTPSLIERLDQPSIADGGQSNEQSGQKLSPASASDGWPGNRDALLFVANLCLASFSIANGIYWVLPIFIGMALACGIAQICATIASAKGSAQP